MTGSTSEAVKEAGPDELDAAFNRLTTDPRVWAELLTGITERFSAGEI